MRAHVGVVERVRRIVLYRELLVGLVRKELKVKYKNSVLGFAWSLLNPLMILFVYYLVFQVILGTPIPQFPIYLLSGVLVWNLWSGALNGATISVLANSALVKKVAFPREILPLAAVGAALVHFFLQAVVLGCALIGFRHAIAPEYLPLLIPATIAIVLTVSALGMVLSAVNAYLRDTQHFVELALIAWFWATPIVYQYGLAQSHITHLWAKLPYFANPLTPAVLTFQRALYATRLTTVKDKTTGVTNVVHILPGWGMTTYLELLGVSLLLGVLAMVGALRVFGRLEGNLAEEL